jgi:hypothetical protein
MNDNPTRLIGMRPNDAMKLERVYFKPSVKYNRPIGVDEPQLSKGTTIRFLLAKGEWENDPFKWCRITAYIKFEELLLERIPQCLFYII